MKRLLPILVFGAISAAFIGPGTVTTAAAAGAGFGFDLLWALVFSTFACLALQEASARLTVVSGLSLGQAMRQRFGCAVPFAVVAAVVLGCAAYEAGNILGAVAGAGLGLELSTEVLTLITGGIAAAVLFSGSPDRVARCMGVIVALMGVGFILCAIEMRPSPSALLSGALYPRLPDGASTLVLGLIGTTVVPYNLFLGSGLARGHTLAEVRLGLSVAIPLGGLISIAVLVVGTAVEGALSYPAISNALSAELGSLAPVQFAFGLFCAGLSSAVTAPLAAAFSVQSMAGEAPDRGTTSWWFRRIWLGVLAIGLLFGLTGVKPIPVIILAQALNGVILPLVALFLLIATNDRSLMGSKHLNGFKANAAIGFSCLAALLIGVTGIVRAASAAIGLKGVDQTWVLIIAAVLAVGVAIPLVREVSRLRRL
ncbi:MAG: divalent metal cation transporter [Myxococcota bacterium]|nr:divalent metal cation transporter [Myxococcota bacterium]